MNVLKHIIKHTKTKQEHMHKSTMHINYKFLSPFLSLINKRGKTNIMKTNISPPKINEGIKHKIAKPLDTKNKSNIAKAF